MASKEVPGTYHGFGLQTWRCLARLLRADMDESVSVEYLDDVSVHSGSSGRKILEQSKSYSTTNPIANRSPELWKTVANWIEVCQEGRATAEACEFILYVDKKQKKTDSLAAQMHAAKTAGKISNVIDAIEQEFWGIAPDFKKKAELAQTLAPHINNVLSVDRALLETIIRNFSVQIGKPDPLDSCLEALRLNSVHELIIEQVALHFVGWIKGEHGRLHANGSLLTIPVRQFRAAFGKYIHKYNPATTLLSTGEVPSAAETLRHLAGRLYVRQLQWIACDPSQTRQAVTQFLKASADRTKWAEAGEIDEDDLKQYGAALSQHWDTMRRTIEIDKRGLPPNDRGQLLFLQCMNHMPALTGRTVPPYFAPGSYHWLADEPELGWHPDYTTLCDDDE